MQIYRTPHKINLLLKILRWKTEVFVTRVLSRTLQAVRQVVHYLAAVMKKKGIELDIKDQYGYTPMHFAAMRGNEAVTMALIELGARVSVSNWYLI